MYPHSKVTAKNLWKEFLALLFPILAVLFIGHASEFLERIFLARYSLAALNGGVQATCALQFFQLTCLAFANMTQVLIGEHFGTGEFFKVGNRTWQMIWISLLSMLIIVPLALAILPFLFKSTEYQEVSCNYFKVLITGNFLFPLGATLSAFFLVQGKRWVVILGSAIAYGIHLLFDFILIFGIPFLVSPMGAQGAAWGGLAGKSVFCAYLVFCFLSKPHQKQYKTDEWKVTLSSIGDCLRICTPRAIGRAFAIFIWTATTYLMIHKGGYYLSVLSIGSSLTLFCRFLADSLTQSLSVIISRYLGSKEYLKVWQSWRLGVYIALSFSGILVLPLILSPEIVLSFFFPEMPSGIEGDFLKYTLYWVWCWIFLYSLNAPLLAFLLAAKDTVYYMILMSLTWVTSCLPIYFCLYHLAGSPDKFWFILIIDQVVVLMLNAWRVYTLSEPYKEQVKRSKTVIMKEPST